MSEMMGATSTVLSARALGPDLAVHVPLIFHALKGTEKWASKLAPNSARMSQRTGTFLKKRTAFHVFSNEYTRNTQMKKHHTNQKGHAMSLVPKGANCTLNATDSAGNGICCDHGKGVYRVYNGRSDHFNIGSLRFFGDARFVLPSMRFVCRARGGGRVHPTRRQTAFTTHFLLNILQVAAVMLHSDWARRLRHELRQIYN
jgi:hypothetical protein